MIKKTFILCITLVVCMLAFSQTKTDSINSSSPAKIIQLKDTIQYTKAGMDYKYSLNNENLTIDRLSQIMYNNPTSMKYLKSAKGTAGFVSVLGYIGGFLIGYPLGTAMAGGQANWTMALVGGGIILVAIPIASSANKNVLKAVKAYNTGTPTSCIDNFDLKFGTTQNGVGFTLRF